MMSLMDLLVLVGMFALRFGVPLLIVIGIGYLLKRLDRRWEAEAWEQQRAAQAAARLAARPGIPKRAPVSQLPFVIPPPPDMRQQPGLVAAPPASRCWDIRGCAESVRSKCVAPRNPELPCWQARFDAEGQIPEECVGCQIFQRYPLM
jgi:hypothetical protein